MRQKLGFLDFVSNLLLASIGIASLGWINASFGTEPDYKLLAANDKMATFEVTYHPGDEMILLPRTMRTFYAVTEVSLERNYTNGKKDTLLLKKGEASVLFSEVQPFVIANHTESDVKLISVILR